MTVKLLNFMQWGDSHEQSPYTLGGSIREEKKERNVYI